MGYECGHDGVDVKIDFAGFRKSASTDRDSRLNATSGLPDRRVTSELVLEIRTARTAVRAIFLTHDEFVQFVMQHASRSVPKLVSETCSFELFDSI